MDARIILMIDNMRRFSKLLLVLSAAIVLSGCSGIYRRPHSNTIVVNSLEDLANPPEGTITLRSGLAAATNGQQITFDSSLDGGTIELSIIGEDHTRP